MINNDTPIVGIPGQILQQVNWWDGDINFYCYFGNHHDATPLRMGAIVAIFKIKWK